MTREDYNLFLKLKCEVDVAVANAVDYFNIDDCCKTVEYSDVSLELEGWRTLPRGGGLEYEYGYIPTVFLIDGEKEVAYAAEDERRAKAVVYQKDKAQALIDAETEVRRQQFEKLKKEFDGPIK